MVSGIKQGDARKQGNAGHTTNQRVRTAALVMIMSLIAMGTIGCGAGRMAGNGSAAENQSQAGSNSNASESQTSSAHAGSNGSPVTGAVLSASNASLNFGDVQVGKSTSQMVTLTNSGTANVSISAVSASGSGFSTSGSGNMTLAPNQSANVYVNFVPGAAGASTGALEVSSDATNWMVSVSLAGSGVTTGHDVELAWTPSTSSVTGYVVERSSVSGGPYAPVSTTLDPNASFTDTTVTSGTYYYVVAAVGANNAQSPFSSEVQAIVP